MLLTSGPGDRSVPDGAGVYSPLQALSSALAMLLVLVAFREWFSIRLDA